MIIPKEIRISFKIIGPLIIQNKYSVAEILVKILTFISIFHSVRKWQWERK